MKNIFTKRLLFTGMIARISRPRFAGLLKTAVLICLLSSNFNSYAQPTVLGTALVNGSYTTYNLNTIGNFRQVKMLATSNAVSGTLNWEFCIGTAGLPDYSTNWRPYTAGLTLAGYNLLVPPVGGTSSALFNNFSGGQSGLVPAVTAGNYYTFNITANGGNNHMSVLETTYSPETITSVTQSPATVGGTVSPTITVVMSSAPASNVYIRYSTNNFTSSILVPLTFVGATGTASIPAQPAGTIVRYYVYNSTKTIAQISTDVSASGELAHDMATLNLNNNAGANYQYTVLPVTVNATNSANDYSYSTLKAAFDAINLGTHTGAINIWISGNTTEGALSAVLNASGAPSFYTSVIIRPSGLSRTVTGNLAAPLVDLNGADNVIIDGLNDGSNSLTISNISTSNTAGTSTIRMYNGALTNTVQNCTIEGSTTNTASGIIFFSTGTNNTISVALNTIRPAGANLPVYSIYANGTANTGIIISSNNIQDYFSATASSAGVFASTGSDAWTVSGNKFYQTAPRTVNTLGVIVRAIHVSAGGGHAISGNTIGYANNAGTGTTTYITTQNNNQVAAIELAGNTIVSSIQGNIISGMSLNSASSVPPASGLFSGIYVSSGSANIGTLSGNIIGATTGTGSISITCSATGIQLFISGIYANAVSPNVVSIQNNNIGGINITAASATVGFNFNAVHVPLTATASYSLIDNITGSSSTANSMNVGIASNATSNFTAINYSGTGNVSAAGNIIQNCVISSTGVSTFRGIILTGGSGAVSISSNSIISCSNSSGGAFFPISNAAAATSLNISDNIIRNITIGSAGGTFTGISNAGAVTGAITINDNKFGNASGGLVTFTVANSANLFGITNTGGTATAALSIQRNDFRGIANISAGSGSHTYIFNSAATISQNISTNTFTSLSINTTTGGVTFISNSVSLGATGTKIIKDNAIVTSFTKTGGGSNLYFYFDAGSSVAGATITNEGNNFSNITINGAMPVQGWFNTDGSIAVPTKNIFNNTFNNITSTASTSINPLQVTNGTGSIYGNTITNISSQNAITGVTVTNGSFNIYSNTINTLSSSVNTFSGVTGIRISGGTTHNVYYHTLHTLNSTTASSAIAGISVTGGSTVRVYKNKLYNFNGVAATDGISIGGGTTVTVDNNLVGNLNANAATDDIVRGIGITGGTTVNVYYNTVYLTAAGGSSNFGSSALFASTTPTLVMRNNILINTSAFFGAGKAVAYRRSNTTLTSYAAVSNNNLFYAGISGASRLIYFDGTNSDQTLPAYQARVSTRDDASQTAILTFLSTTGSSLQYLHLNGANAASNNGAVVGSFTDDYDDEVRSGSTPDIGADEFSSTSCVANATITSVSSPAPYYAGDVITITGTNLAGITYATINDINAIIGVTTATTAQLTIPTTMADSIGVIQVAESSSCPFSGTTSFVFSGYITKGAGLGNGTWSTATIWRNNALPVNNAPAIINNGDAVTLNVSADPIKFTILSTGSFTHPTDQLVFGATYLNNTAVDGNLIVDNGSTLTSSSRFISPTLVVTNGGTFTNNSANAAAVTIANFYVNAGGTYNHNAVGSTPAGVINDFPGSTLRSYGNTSNVVVTKWAGTNPLVAPGTGLPASGSPGWGNLTINVATLFGSWNQAGALTNVQGNLNIMTTGGGTNEFRLTGNTATLLTIGGSLDISGGGFVGNTGTASPTINIGADLNITGGYFWPCENSNTTCTVNITGNCTLNGGHIVGAGSSRNYVMTMASLTVTGNSVFGLSRSSSSTLILNTGSITISGNATMYSYSSGLITINCTGNFSSTSTGTASTVAIATPAILTPASAVPLAFCFQRSSNTPALTLNLGGNFAVTGTGLFFGGSGSSPASINFTGGAASVTYNAAPSVMAVTSPSNVKNNFFVTSGKTLTLLTSILPASPSTSNNWNFTVNTGATLVCGTNEIGTNAATARTGFTLQTGGTLKTGNVGGVFGTTTGTASITTTLALASFSSGATYEFNGSSAQVTSAFTTTPTAATVANMIINNTNAAGVTLSQSFDVTAALQLQTGNLTLSTFNLTTVNITGAPYSNTKMVVTNSTGALGQPVALATILYPVGNSGNYTPASYTFTANSTARYLNVRAVTPRNANDVSATDYINNRWWNTDLSVNTGSYSYSSVYTYISGDMVGVAANIRLNRWTGSAWVNDAASVVNNTNFTITSGALNESTGTLSATAQWVGRVYVAPAIYHWVNAAGGSWLVPGNWSPTGVPGSGDGVIFDVAGGATYTTTNMPTGIGLTQFTVNTNNIVTFNAGTAGTISLLFPGTATPQFNIASGSSMTISGANAVNFNLPANATGTVAGTLRLQQSTHTVTVTTAGALVFPAGGYFAAGIVPATGFSGNPFGTTGTNGAVIFQNGSVCECFEGANPFGGVGVNITTFQTNSLFRYSDPTVSSPSISGRTYSNFTYNANKVTSVAAASSFICDSLTVAVGTFNLNLQGTPTPDHSIRGNINVASGATLSFSPAAAGTVNMNSGATQIIWGAGTFNVNALSIVDINAGTTASLQKNMGVSSTGNVVVNGTLIATGENFINSPTAGGTVTMNSGSALSIQSIDGISSTGIGNVRSTNFIYNGGNFTYSGAANQNTGDRLPNTITGTGVLTILNTGIAPNDIVTLLPNNKTVTTLNLNSGRFNAGTAGELLIQAGVLNASGGNQYLGGTANDNIIRFDGGGVINGTPELYNVTAGGGNVDFINNARINNIFKLNLLGAVVNHSPKYAVGSTLIYNNTGSYNRDFEWGTNTALAPSYPHHVIIQNGTTVYFTASTPTPIGCGGDLTIGSPSGAGTGILDISAAGAKNLYVAGNINIGGNAGTSSLIMSNTIGADIYLTGNWTRNANGTVNFGAGNGRAVFFEGSTDATITANNGQTFPYVFINKSAKANKVTLADNVNISYEINFTKGTVDLGTNDKFLTILSSSTVTARVAPISNPADIDFVYGATDKLGQFIIQRYVPARRSWRLMAAPLKPTGGSHSISEAWQERGTPLLGLDYTAASWVASVAADTIASTGGFATQITGGSAANGFDQSPNNNTSIKYYNAGSWLAPANINATSVNSLEGWMLFVRGDRKNYGEITNQFKTPTITTLRPRGQIFIGTKSITSAGMTVVGNPYASAIDFNSMIRTGAGWPANPTYYVWDPYLGGTTGQGAFITLTWNSTNLNFDRSAPLTGIGTSTFDNRYIPSGAAIMVDFPSGGGTLTFNETDKNAANTTLAFRQASNQLMTVLNTVNADGTSFVSDGALSLFDNAFNNEADINDARKLGNFTENFGLQRTGQILSIERKKLAGDADTIFYYTGRMQRKNYQLQFIMDKIGAPSSTTAFLEDLYLKTKTPVNMQDTTWVDFSINADAASAATDRFRLVFRRSVQYTGINAFVLKGDIAVDWKVADEFNVKEYTIERSTDGITFSAAGTVLSAGNSSNPVSYRWLDAGPQPGHYFYRIKSVSKNGVITYSDVAKVTIVKYSPDLYVFPNPVTSNTILLQMNDQPAGQYQARLLNGTGQLLLNTKIQHGGGLNTHLIHFENLLAKGIYNLEVTGPDKKIAIIKVVVE
ncbi:MAG: hypothetical protein IPP72_21835 [Chitinophagaceae bacterium]|nr:hypothetical protein [Chitinophagaceae bacterium]